MSVDEFFVWADGRDGKYEFLDGEVIAMSPERVRHADVKLAACDALRAAIRNGNLPCRVLLDGVALRIDAATSYVPDMRVYCGARADSDAVEVSDPIIVVEIVSSSSRSIDTNRKLAGYFRVPSGMHDLVLDPSGSLVIHHWRGNEGGSEARILSSGTLDLSPPGPSVAIEDLFAEP